jgi:RNA polymerase sigma-70 factor (ECF subfamily)
MQKSLVLDGLLTSPTLLVALRSGDQEAWRQLVRIYGPLVVSWCRRCGLQESDALDVSQEVLVGVDQSLGRFEHRSRPGGASGSFRGWLWTVTRNKLADFHRRNSRHPLAGGGTDALACILAIPDSAPHQADDIADLHFRVLQELKLEFDHRTWEAFWRVVVEKDAPKDVAEDLGVTVWAIYKLRTRILAKLKARFSEEFHPHRSL